MIRTSTAFSVLSLLMFADVFIVAELRKMMESIEGGDRLDPAANKR